MNSPADLKPNILQAVPFFWVNDITVSSRFYVDGLGFVMTRHWSPDGTLKWCWLELGSASLMLQEFWRDGPNRNHTDEALGVGISVYFICRDALSFYRELQSRAIKAKRPFVGNGMWVTAVKDPDGYSLFFESPTDVAEESEYNDDGTWTSPE